MMVALSAATGAAIAAKTSVTTLTTLQRDGSIASYADTVVWSEYDAKTNRYYLTEKSFDRPATRLPVAPSRHNDFGQAVNEGPGKQIWIVYSRCKGRSCKTYGYAMADKKQRRLPRSTVTTAGNHLVLFKGDTIVLQTLSGKVQETIKSPALRGYASAKRRYPRRVAAEDDLIAYFVGRNLDTAIWLTDTKTERTTLVARRGLGEDGLRYSAPALDRGRVFYTADCDVIAGCAATVQAYSPRTRRTMRAGGGPPFAADFARSDGVSYFLAYDTDEPDGSVRCPCDLNAVRGQKFK